MHDKYKLLLSRAKWWLYGYTIHARIYESYISTSSMCSLFGGIFLLVCVGSFWFVAVVVVVVGVSTSSSSSSIPSSLASISFLLFLFTIIIIIIAILDILSLVPILLLFFLPFRPLLLIFLPAFLIAFFIIVLILLAISWGLRGCLLFLLYFTLILFFGLIGRLLFLEVTLVFIWLSADNGLCFWIAHGYIFDFIFSVVFLVLFMLGTNTSCSFCITVTFNQMQLLNLGIVFATGIRWILLFFLIILEHRSFLIVHQIIVLVFILNCYFGPIVFVQFFIIVILPLSFWNHDFKGI